MKQTINIEEKVSLAKQYFKEGYNCAQAVAMAYSDICHLDKEILAKASIAFGGGFGRQREICGAVSGAGVVLGLAQNALEGIEQDKKQAYATVQQLTSLFTKENGHFICGKLLNLHSEEISSESQPQSTFKRRPCVDYVASATRIIGHLIHEPESEK